MKGLGKDVSFQYRSQLLPSVQNHWKRWRSLPGVTKEEIGIVRNASEGNSIMVQGFDLKPGEEIILWDQNHPSNSIAWEQKAKRSGFVVKKIAMPASPKSTSELVDAFAKAITPKTRMISFSHISNTSGMALPAKEICQLQKAKRS
ncbi:MAG: aminotransferase class V-fold PLP-dependent enzyme [Bacteroidota bacterium]